MNVLPEDALRAAVRSWTGCNLWTSQGQRLTTPRDASDVMRLAVVKRHPVLTPRATFGIDPLV
jgi:hypothetical protein